MSEFGQHAFVDPSSGHDYDGPPPDVYVNPRDYADEAHWYAVNGAMQADAQRQAWDAANYDRVTESSDLLLGHFRMDEFDESNPYGYTGELVTRGTGLYPLDWGKKLDYVLTYLRVGLTEERQWEVAHSLSRVNKAFIADRYHEIKTLVERFRLNDNKKQEYYLIWDLSKDPDAWDGIFDFPKSK